ncbi:MAG: cytochrome b/b6 domain-containing protein [Pseudomonadota bacterium]
MSLANTASRYGSVAKTFHWLTALLIFTVFPLGAVANNMAYQIKTAASPDPDLIAQTAWLFSLHKTLGIAVFFVALARILWAFSQPKPAPMHPERRLETFAADTAHWLLYSSLVIVPLSGWIHHAATTGFAPIWWPLGQGLPLVPQSQAVESFFAGVHIVVTKVLLIALAAHVAGALKHALIDRDGVLARMWFGRTDLPAPAADHHVARPVATAFVVWAAALGIGGGLGVYQSAGGIAAAATLEEVDSEWRVEDGTIALTVTQFGNQVGGEFADFTAAIDFDETVATGRAGSAEVTIAIGSLSLGSVTDQAMGADYFDTAGFPTATFTADIVALEDGHEATGTLTIKDQSQPITFPVDIAVDGDTATATGTVSLNRMNYGVGASQQDEGTLAFAVDVQIEVTATRGGEAAGSS